MPDTFTSNYGWTKPAVGGDAATWGGTLNSDLDEIDDRMFITETQANACPPVGSIIAVATNSDSAIGSWVPCDGSVYNVSDLPALFAVIGNAFPGGDGVTTFAVPNLGATVLFGISPGSFSVGDIFLEGYNPGSDIPYMAMGYFMRFE